MTGPGATGPARFAAAVAGRHGRRAARVPAAPVVPLVGRRAPVVVHRHLAWSTRVAVHVARPESRRREPGIPLVATSAPAARVARGLAPLAEPRRDAPAERIRAAARRIEAGPPGAVPASSVARPPGGAPVVPRVPTVVRRVRPTAPAGDHPAAPAARARGPAAATPVELSPVEVGRVTEHVLRTLDRRVVALRERQGRS